ncbi:YraN family protein [Porticoccaceae bacterium]|nr:YraN family protein [Porticoccaceae bacterium]
MARINTHRAQESGRKAEQLAAKWLQQRGLELIERNYHAPCGEIDLVMRDNSGWVFVEVRFRNSLRFGGATASLTPSKLRRLRATAEHYLQHRTQRASFARIDALLIDGPAVNDTSTQINWIKNISGEYH